MVVPNFILLNSGIILGKHFASYQGRWKPIEHINFLKHIFYTLNIMHPNRQGGGYQQNSAPIWRHQENQHLQLVRQHDQGEREDGSH